MTQWSSRPQNSDIFVRKGAGNPWLALELDAETDAPSGGGQSYESRWGRGANGGLALRGTAVTGNPERIDGQMMLRLRSETYLTSLQKMKCLPDFLILQACAVKGIPLNYTMALGLLEAPITSRGYSENLANATEDNEPDVKETYDYSAALDYRTKKMQHLDISGTWSDFAYNKAISVGATQCAGDCGPESDGAQEFWLVSDRDTTPGYSALNVPKFDWTTDQAGSVRNSVYVDVLGNSDGVDVVRMGNNIVVVSTTGVAYASIQNVYDQVANPWTLATGITGTPKAIAVIDALTAYLVGASGKIWKSTDGAASWTLIDNGATTSQNLNSIAKASDTLLWIGGNSGVLIKLIVIGSGTTSSQTISLVNIITSAGASILSAGENINVVAAPPFRDEVYLGTSGGKIVRSTRANVTRPIFENKSFPKSGTGQINDLQFVGYKGNMLFILQRNAAGNSRVLRDISGGYLTDSQTEVIGDFTTPVNNQMNSIAPANENYAMVVGEVESTYAYVGSVLAA
jgi:hypothetical protein